MTKKYVVHIRIDPAEIAERSTIPELAQLKKALADGHCVLLAPTNSDEPPRPYVISPAALQRLTTIVIVIAWTSVFAIAALLLLPEFLLGIPIAAGVGAKLGYEMDKRDLRS